MEADNVEYLEVVSSYLHLHPARAGLILIGQEKLKGYRWSSDPWYVGGGRGAPAWLERKRVMEALGLGLKAGRAELEGQWKALRRGWYAGGETFAEKLRGRIQRLLAGRRPESHSGAAKRENGYTPQLN
jgi:hypothetical protein